MTAATSAAAQSALLTSAQAGRRAPKRVLLIGVAGALVMYDRVISLGRHAPRPVAEGAPTEAVELPVFGEPMYKRRLRLRQKAEAKQ